MAACPPHTAGEDRSSRHLLQRHPVPGDGTWVVVLERLGHHVVFPDQQTCCGQMHGNSGYAPEGAALAERLERAFAEEQTIVSPSASCVSYVREQRPALQGGYSSSPSC
jgi:hypothetical protein